MALFTRLMPAANSGASSPLSAASAASLQIADTLIMMEDEPRRRSSSGTRHALTVALVKPGRGSCWNQGHELVQSHVVDAFYYGQGDAVEHERLQFL
jgi:hypothetical protein